MTTMPNEDWFTCLPSCSVEIPCGSGRHVVRWEAGVLRLDSHPDPEAELVLAALGGEKARCVEVAAACAARPDEPDEHGRSRRPVLTAALDGRLAPVAGQWLGIDPDQVQVSLHTGPGWGSAELTGPGEQRRLRISLPADWLARVW